MKMTIAVLAATLLATPALALAPAMHGIKEGNRATAALNALESKGYPDFTNFHRVGSDFAANVTKNGQMMHVIVAPDTGTISVQS